MADEEIRLDTRLKHWPIPPLEHSYRRQDAALYALNVGAGEDPFDVTALRLTRHEVVQPLPTYLATLAANSPWLFDPANGVDSQSILLRELNMEFKGVIPPEGSVVFYERVDAVWDRGPDRGAILHLVGDMKDKATGEIIATIERVTIALRNGGFGGVRPPQSRPTAPPSRAPDREHVFQTRPDAALMFRLHGDLHPLHWNAGFAADKGFHTPLLHGMCTLGVVCNALLRDYVEYRSERLQAIRMLFKSPVFPGDALRTRSWREGSHLYFQTFVDDRSLLVADGSAQLQESASF